MSESPKPEKPASTAPKRVRCPCCDRIVNQRDLREVEGSTYCPACLSSNVVATYDGGQCRHRNATQVRYRNVGGHWRTGYISRLNVTPEHRRCPSCAMLQLPDTLWHTVRGRNPAYEGINDDVNPPTMEMEVCACCSENTFECNTCHGTFLTNARTSGYICTGCHHDSIHDETDTYSDLDCPTTWCTHVREYHAFDPVREFGISLDRDTIYYGTELEHEWYGVRSRGKFRQVGRKIHEYFKQQGVPVLLSQDGSIDSGAELVSIPMKLEDHLEVYKGYWDTVTELCAEDNTGLHVHVSRSPLSRIVQGRLVHFVNANANRAFMIQIARRESSEWAGFDSSKIRDNALEDTSRYSAVNVGRSATLEFRLFKSADNFQEYAVTLEFVDALIRFCKEHEFDDLLYTKFIEFVSILHMETHPHLSRWLEVNFPGVCLAATV